MRVALHGGVAEIGGNKVLVEDGDTRVFLDFGMSFARQQAFFDEFLKARPVLRDLLKLGILPSLDGIYRDDLVRPSGWEEATRTETWPDTYWTLPVQTGAEYRAKHGKAGIDAVVLTHAHADHVNHIAYLDSTIPVFCSPITNSLVRAISDVTKGGVENQFYEVTPRAFKRSDPTSKAATFPGSWTLERGDAIMRPYHTQAELQPFKIGSLTITLVPVDHSVPGACAIHVRGGNGKTILYTGDIRFHGHLRDRQAALRDFAARHPVDLMICEGTRISSESADTEDGVFQNVEKTVAKTTGLALVEFGWKDTTRFDTLQKVAERTGRTLVVSPKLAYLMRVLRDEVGAPFKGVRDQANVRTYLDRRASLLYSASDYSNAKYAAGEAADWGDKKSPAWTPHEREIFLSHLDHGVRAPEIRANPTRFILGLSYFELSDLHDIEPPPGSTWTRAQCEPFNVEMEMDVKRQENWLRAFGLNEDAGGEVLTAHASGHACGPDIRAFVKLAAPRRLVPIHTVHPDLFAGACDDIVDWGARRGEPVVVEV